MATRCSELSVSLDGGEPPGRGLPRSVKVAGGIAIGGIAGAFVRGLE